MYEKLKLPEWKEKLAKRSFSQLFISPGKALKNLMLLSMPEEYRKWIYSGEKVNRSLHKYNFDIPFVPESQSALNTVPESQSALNRRTEIYLKIKNESDKAVEVDKVTGDALTDFYSELYLQGAY